MSANRRIRVWTTPIVLGALTSVGLISALVSDSAGDVLAWIALGVPVAVVLWFAPRRRRGEAKSPAEDARHGATIRIDS